MDIPMQCADRVSYKSTDNNNDNCNASKKMESEAFRETFGGFRLIAMFGLSTSDFHKSSVSKFLVYYRVKQ